MNFDGCIKSYNIHHNHDVTPNLSLVPFLVSHFIFSLPLPVHGNF